MTALKSLNLSADHLDMLDRIIATDPLLRLQDAADNLRGAASGAPPMQRDRATAKRRREYIERMIEERAAPEARWPDSVEVRAPAEGKADELRAVSEWLAALESRLTAEAPPAVQRAIRYNRFRRMVETDPEGAIAAVEAAFADMGGAADD